MPTVSDLKDQLDEAGVEYDPKAKKAELEKLAKKSSVSVLPPKDLDPEPDSLQVAVSALEEIAGAATAEGHDLTITSVGKAAQVARDALEQIDA